MPPPDASAKITRVVAGALIGEWNWQSNSPTRFSSCLIVGEREHSAAASILKLSSKPTSYPGLFRGPRRLGHELYKRGNWRRPIVSSKSHSWIPPSLFCQGRGVPYLSWGVRRRLAGGARHDESFGRPSNICLRDRIGHGDRAGGSEAANLIEASREGAWGCAAELLPHIILSASRRIVAMPRAFHLEGCPWCASPY
jgi:hypothetical protein